jgi:hypothetical protein
MLKYRKVFTTIVIISVLVIGCKYYRQGQIKNLFERERIIAVRQTEKYEYQYYNRGGKLYFQELLVILGNFIETEHDFDRIYSTELPSRERTMKLQYELRHDKGMALNFDDSIEQHLEEMFQRWLNNDFSNSVNDYNYIYRLYTYYFNHYFPSINEDNRLIKITTLCEVSFPRFEHYGKAIKLSKLAGTFKMNKNELYRYAGGKITTFKIIHYYYTGNDGKRVYTFKIINIATGQQVKNRTIYYNIP